MEDIEIISPEPINTDSPAVDVIPSEETPQEKSNDSSVAGAVFRKTIVGNAINPHINVAKTTLDMHSWGMFRNEETPISDRDVALADVPEEDRHHYDWCESMEDINLETGQLNLERSDRHILNEHPIESLATGVLVGLVDVPFFLALSAGGAGAGLASKMAHGAVTGLGYGAANAGTQLVTKDLYDTEEATYETLGCALVGGAIPAVLTGIESIGYKTTIVDEVVSKAGKALGEAMSGKESTFRMILKNEAGTPSLTEVRIDSNGETATTMSKEMRPWLKKVFGKLNPITRGLMSDSTVLRNYTDATYVHNIVHSNKLDVLSAETGKRMDRANLDYVLSTISDSKTKWMNSNGFNLASTEEKTNLLESFNTQVARHLRGIELSQDPHVLQAINQYKNWQFNLVDDGIKFKAFGDIRKVENYYTTVYDRTKINENLPEFRALVRDKVRERSASLPEKQLETAVDEVMDHILGDNLEIYALDQPMGVGGTDITKKRTLLITPDDFLQFEKFLVNDPIKVATTVNRKFSPIIQSSRALQAVYEAQPELAKTLTNQDLSNEPINQWLSLLEKEKKAKLSETTSATKHKEITEQYKQYAELMVSGDQLLHGTYDAPKTGADLNFLKMSNLIQTYNYTRMLGNVGLTSLIDAKNIVNRFGFGRAVSGLVRGCLKDSSFNLNKKDLIKFGAASEHAHLQLKEKFAMYSDLAPYGVSKFEKLVEKGANKFSKFTGMPLINDYQKTVVANLHGSDILSACCDHTISNRVEFLKNNKITEDMAKRIQKAFVDAGGYFDEHGLAVFNLQKWKDKEATRMFGGAINAVSNQTILVPSMGDTPLLLKSKWGKLLFQFRTYQFSLTNNIILPWFQGQNQHAGASIAFGLGMSYAVTYLKSLASGDPYTHIDDPDWHASALEQSDTFGIFGDFYSFGRRCLNSRNTFADAAKNISPTISGASDLFAVKNSLIRSYERDTLMSEKDLRTIKRLLPFNNVLGFSAAVNAGVGAYSEATGRKLMKEREYYYQKNKGE